MRVSMVIVGSLFVLACSAPAPARHDASVDAWAPDTTLRSCYVDADCGSGLHCSTGLRCIARGTCLVDADCGTGATCDAGACTP